MGKRKRRTDQNKTPPPSDRMPYSSRMDSLSKEKCSHSVDSSALNPLSSIMDVMDSSVELPHTHHSLGHKHHNLSRALLLRHPRHYYGRQYSRRNSVNNADASTSHGKGISLRDEKLSFKLTSLCNSDSGRHTENKEKAYCKPERIRSSSLAMDAVSADVVKMVCGICQKLLKRKPYILGNTLSSSDLSVVAVLVCGHVHHADCLEQRTCHEDRQDPPCPLCVGLLSQVDA
uniref:RING-type domain-containing protein n=1 Tax=Davidia involucrata TaxID=16924 RepID=A0A5B6ZCV5_DAVIN